MKLLLGLLAFLALAGLGRAYIYLPLNISFGFNSSWSPSPEQPERTDGRQGQELELALASDPSGKVRFIEMVNNLKGGSGRGYYLPMLIGTPVQKLNILVDTGSSNFAVAGAPDPSISAYFKPQLWIGELGTDVVTLSQGLNSSITVDIAVILESENFYLEGAKWQGILGMAYKPLSMPSGSVETFFDSLVKQTNIPDVFSLQMCGAGLPVSTDIEDIPAGGSLILGGVEPSLYVGDVWYTPITKEWYYQVEILKLEVGGQNLHLDCKEYNAGKAIVDSGTSLLRLPNNVFDAVVEAIIWTSAVQTFSAEFWTGAEMACWSKGATPWNFFPKISIYLRGENASQSFRITVLPQLYIQPVVEIGQNLECYRFGISSSSNGLVIGATVMEGFYVIFDRVQKRVGFAVSRCAEVAGSQVSEVAGPFSSLDVSSNCLSPTGEQEPILWIFSYALMALCGITLFILIILLLFPCRCHHGDSDAINDESSLIRNRIK
ncbi:beta-secretase 2 isoform X2 [Latimeria chalumnae]|uniref:beta-secretase 2 isoform X2 n=1 Tax=Latimeria chalumnae TaxID=7897 RepID=UPI0006D90246|nr:PREDICTED: beta-secretase 2 isoform X2 [Latimeria chalumnae]|eukprot:XP_005992824.2 PREDICTED: beta-secretase 2 isoform X2 [Latimeria chalumnae]